jgi:hypothetical protein
MMAVGNWQSAVGEVDTNGNSVLPRSSCLAARHAISRIYLPGNKVISARRIVWNGFADAPFRSIGSGQYRRRLWSREQGFLYSVSSNSTGLSKGTRNAFNFVETGRCRYGIGHGQTFVSVRRCRKNVASSHTFPGKNMTSYCLMPTAYCRCGASQ